MFKIGPASLILAASTGWAGAQLAIPALTLNPPPLASLALWGAAILALAVRFALVIPQE